MMLPGPILLSLEFVPADLCLRIFTSALSEVPSTTNPLGLRGGGEGGTTPAPAAVVNAIVDALAHLGVELEGQEAMR